MCGRCCYRCLDFLFKVDCINGTRTCQCSIEFRSTVVTLQMVCFTSLNCACVFPSHGNSVHKLWPASLVVLAVVIASQSGHICVLQKLSEVCVRGHFVTCEICGRIACWIGGAPSRKPRCNRQRREFAAPELDSAYFCTSGWYVLAGQWLWGSNGIPCKLVWPKLVPIVTCILMALIVRTAESSITSATAIIGIHGCIRIALIVRTAESIAIATAVIGSHGCRANNAGNEDHCELSGCHLCELNVGGVRPCLLVLLLEPK